LGVGPVGEHIVKILGERGFPIDGEIEIMATREREEIICGRAVTVRRIGEELLGRLDLVFFAGKEGAKGASLEWAEVAARRGCVVIDNGGDLRMYPHIPLVVPEINMDAVTAESRIICNPNCSTIQMAVALYPLHRAARLRRVVVSTYQSVSGHSGAGITQLERELAQAAMNAPVRGDPSVFARQIAYNCVPHIDRFERSGYTREETKLVNETRKIFGEPDLLISATAVRVPVAVGHSESVNAQFFEPMRAEEAVRILSDPALSPGVVCIDGPNGGAEAREIRRDTWERRYPTPADLAADMWKDSVLVGRIRDDATAPNAINLWCVSDNLRKGAAANAVQIAEGMLARGLLRG
jgi:aspartate-semialdehyde dehydrogenase